MSIKAGVLVLAWALVAVPLAEAAPPVMNAIATWYDVPPQSIPKKRAPGEFIAAHHSLPLGTRVLVTSAASGRCTVVRITDRGVGKGRIDLCREAAEQIGLVGKGRLHVKLEVLGG